MTTATVAAVLTVLGYSMYDTIIILDRIRENIPLMRRASFRVIGNVSLWETIPRSLATTFITLIPIAALYLFGGETLKDFAFALLIGIGSGAYSSIFVAAPLVAMLKQREPEYARRRDDLGALEGIESVGGVVADLAEDGKPAEAEPEDVPDTCADAGCRAGSRSRALLLQARTAASATFVPAARARTVEMADEQDTSEQSPREPLEQEAAEHDSSRAARAAAARGHRLGIAYRGGGRRAGRRPGSPGRNRT